MIVTVNGFHELFRAIKPELYHELVNYLAEMKCQSYGMHPSKLDVIVEIELFSLNGGKRLSTILACLGNCCSCGPEEERMIRIVCAWDRWWTCSCLKSHLKLQKI